MIDIEEFLTDRPGHPLNKSAAKRVRAVFDGLEDIFTTSRSRIDSVTAGDGGHCLSILFATPYLSADQRNKETFANLLRLADSAAVSSRAEDDGYSALIVFTFVLWD